MSDALTVLRRAVGRVSCEMGGSVAKVELLGAWWQSVLDSRRRFFLYEISYLPRAAEHLPKPCDVFCSIFLALALTNVSVNVRSRNRNLDKSWH